MKRVILSLTATVVGVVALLSFKTEGKIAVSSTGLPSAGLPGTSQSTVPSTGASTTTSGAPPNPATSGSTSSVTSPNASGPTSISYTGTAEQTQYGIVQVKITVTGKKITNVGFVQLTA